MAKTLTPISVKNAPARAARREIPDGGCRGLYLVVQPSGIKSWAARYRYRGKSGKHTLGPALIDTRESGEPLQHGAQHDATPLSLAEARELCARVLREVQAGRAPVAERRRRKQQHKAEANTFENIAEEFLRREGGRLRTLGQRKADLALLYPSLGQLPLEGVKRGQFVREFDAIDDQRGPVRANRVQSATKRLLNWYSARSDYISVLTRVPARISIAERARSHVPSDVELKAIILAARQDKLFGSYLAFTLLTCTRRGESAGLRRSELSSDGTTWVIPKERYKSKRDLLIPLSTAAQQILAAMPVLPRGDYVFSVNGAAPLGSFAASKKAFDAACGVRGWRLHDLRRAARTLLSRAGVNVDIAERCLGHVMAPIRGTYDRYEYQVEKRDAFEKLAAQIERIVRGPEPVADLAAERKRRRK
jgi:integrase